MVTDQQVRMLFMLINKVNTKAIAAAKAGMNEKTARKYLKVRKLPDQMKKPHAWRTRKDSFEENWPEVIHLLECNLGLEAKTIFNELNRKHPGKYSEGQLRTLQRKIKIWRATQGPAKEIYFAQKHHPGRLSQFDFTDMSVLQITIQKVHYKHLIGHFTLTYSNWETGTVCFSESFESFSHGYQNALWELGGVPLNNRTDRLSSAVHKECNPEEFTRRYVELLHHYGAKGEKTNPASPNENGDVEQRHNRLKKAIKQALMLRGSSDFETRNEYEAFLRKLFNQLNSPRKEKLIEEFKALKPLPEARQEVCKRIDLKVGPGSTINVLHNIYTVHSRLKGENIKVKAYPDHIEIWYAQKKVDSFPRMRGESKRRINYRHIIEWLRRKPGAFENYRYKEELFPTSYFRMAYDYLKKTMPARASKEYLDILYLAFKEGESKVECAIRELIERQEVPGTDSVKKIIDSTNDNTSIPEISITGVDLNEYDGLLTTYKEEVPING